MPLVITCFSLANCVIQDTKQVSPTPYEIKTSETAVNINTASAQELERLPHVGEKIAQRIIEHREKFGGFRRIEQLLLIDGISDERFREIRNFVKVE